MIETILTGQSHAVGKCTCGSYGAGVQLIHPAKERNGSARSACHKMISLEIGRSLRIGAVFTAMLLPLAPARLAAADPVPQTITWPFGTAITSHLDDPFDAHP